MRTERLAGLDTISEIEMSLYHPISSQPEVAGRLSVIDTLLVVSKGKT